jgi:hypothetical protein
MNFPAHRDDPLTETLRAVAGIAADNTYADTFVAFQANMVYGGRTDFATAIATLDAIANGLR